MANRNWKKTAAFLLAFTLAATPVASNMAVLSASAEEVAVETPVEEVTEEVTEEETEAVEETEAATEEEAEEGTEGFVEAGNLEQPVLGSGVGVSDALDQDGSPDVQQDEQQELKEPTIIKKFGATVTEEDILYAVAKENGLKVLKYDDDYILKLDEEYGFTDYNVEKFELKGADQSGIINSFNCSYTVSYTKYTRYGEGSGFNESPGVLNGTIKVNPIELTSDNVTLTPDPTTKTTKVVYKYENTEVDITDYVALQYSKDGITYSGNFPTEDGKYSVKINSKDTNKVYTPEDGINVDNQNFDTSDEFKVKEDVAKNGVVLTEGETLTADDFESYFTNTYEKGENGDYDKIVYTSSNPEIAMAVGNAAGELQSIEYVKPGKVTITAKLIKTNSGVTGDETKATAELTVNVKADLAEGKTTAEAVVEGYSRKLVVKHNGDVVPEGQYTVTECQFFNETKGTWEDVKNVDIIKDGFDKAGKYRFKVTAKAADEDAESLYTGSKTFEEVEAKEFTKISTLVFEKTAYKVTKENDLVLKRGTDYSYLPENADLKLIEWKSSDEKIATVENGIVKFVAPGKVTITATAVNEDDVEGEKSDNVVATVEVTAIGAITNDNVTIDEKTNKVVVNYGDKTLTEGTDYTVNYKKSANDKGTATYPTEPGKYSVTVTGTGLYKGEVELDENLVVNNFEEKWSFDVIKVTNGEGIEEPVTVETVDKDGNKGTTTKYHYHRSTVYTADDPEWNEEGKGYDKLIANVYDDEATDESYYTCAESKYVDEARKDDAIQAAANVNKKIEILPSAEKATAANLADALAAAKDYSALSNFAQTYVKEGYYEKLMAVLNKAYALDIDAKAKAIDIDNIKANDKDAKAVLDEYDAYVKYAEKMGVENLVTEKERIEAIRAQYVPAQAKYDFETGVAAIQQFREDENFKYDATDLNDKTTKLEDVIAQTRDGYDNMTDAQKALVSDAKLKVLTDAETEYAELKAAAEKLAADTKAAKDVYDTVKELYDRFRKEDSTLEDITQKEYEDAAAAYAALNKEAKAIADKEVVAEHTIDNETVTVNIEKALDILKLIVDGNNFKAAQKAINAIDIKKIELNDESKALIDAARTAYDALAPEAQEVIQNLNNLEIAEKIYNALAAEAAAKKDAKTAAEEAKAAADKAAKDLETANGKVTKLEGQLEEAKNKVADYEQMAKALEDAKKELADAQKAATEANTALTQATNDLADTKTKLDEAETAKADAEKAKADAEAKYNALKESSNATEEDLAAAKILIEAADEIISAADEEIKGLKTNVSDLEAKVDELTKGKDAADEVVANAVVEKINNIGEVKKNNQSKYLIVSARSAYDTLTDDQKALVDNYETLEDAEETYAALPQTGMSGAHKAFAGLAALIGAAGFGMFKLGKKKDEDQ